MDEKTLKQKLVELLKKKVEEGNQQKKTENFSKLIDSLGEDSTSLKGEQGPQGERGETGPVGPQGAKGEPGKNGKDGKDGRDGRDGKDGYTPRKGVDYFDGKDGRDGKDGKDFDDKQAKTFADEIYTNVNKAITSLDKMNVKSVSVNGAKVGNFNDINFKGSAVTAVNNGNQGVDVTITSGGGSGTVTGISVATANGLAGTSDGNAATPTLTLSTSVNGIVKGNGTALSAATAGTDYTTPTGAEGLTNKTITSPKIVTSILDTNGNTLVGVTPTASAVDYLNITNGATGTPGVVLLSAAGADSNVQLKLSPKGTGRVRVSDGTDTTKTLDFNISGSTTGINTTFSVSSTGLRTITFPDATDTLIGKATSDALTNKTYNGLTVSTTTGTLTIANAKTATVNNSLTFSGTDSTTMTFPSTNATIARTDAAQTFTGVQTFAQIVTTPATITVTTNAGTVTRTNRVNNFTNSSAAAMTITMSTTGALDGDMVMVRIYDFSAVAQTITWVNTENSTVTAPTTSNGSTTLPLTVGFQYNSATSKWRCIASA